MDRDELIGSSSFKGPKDAEIVLLKFSDFQCPYCAQAAVDMKALTKVHPDDVLYVYKQFPLVSIHDKALPAAKAAWAASQQDQFWLYHDGLFAYQDKLGEAYYLELAEKIGLDMDKFNRDRNSPEAQAAIDQDVALAEALGIRGTPTFIMNDLLIPGGAPLSFFEEAISRFKAGTINE
jgi:protein-disulfide isomerase